MTAGSERQWRVGELAEATGVTIRALHHYDKLGLLVPSRRTTAGHRLYAERDVRRLYRVLALRALGFPLSEIARLLDDDAPDLTATVRRHLQRVARELEQSERLHIRLVEMLSALEQALQPTIDEFIDAMEAMTVIQTNMDVVMRVPYEPGAPGDAPRLKHHHRDLKVVLLKETGGSRILPIWIGADEGHALALALCGEGSPRPLSHDLTTRVLDITGARVERVTIERREANTYFATLTVTTDGTSHDIDARPSDALNVAARAHAPVVVEPRVMDERSVASERDLHRRLNHGPRNSRDPSPPPPGEWRSLTEDVMRSLAPGDDAEQRGDSGR